ncbi:hypothetical protein L1283_005618 [Sphingobacterium sp. HSC-15S19]
MVNTPDWQEANFVLTGNAKSAQLLRKVIKQKTNGMFFYTATG